MKIYLKQNEVPRHLLTKVMLVLSFIVAWTSKVRRLKCNGQGSLLIEMKSEDEASIRVSLLLILDCSSCQSYQSTQRTLPCQHTVCNKCIERSRRAGVLTCAECGAIHKIPKEWTRLYPINLQLLKIAKCTDVYKQTVSSSVETESLDSEEVKKWSELPSEGVPQKLLENLKILETSGNIYHDDIIERVKADIKTLKKSSETVQLIIKDRVNDLRILVNARENSLLQEVQELEKAESKILEIHLHKNEKDVENIKQFCVKIRKLIGTYGIVEGSIVDEELAKSFQLMDIFRQAKTSRSRVPKIIVFVDRSAPKKRLKANINTYGKVIVDTAASREDYMESVKPGEDKAMDDLGPKVITPKILLNKANKNIDTVSSRLPGVSIPRIRDVGHSRHHSIDSGIEDSSIESIKKRYQLNTKQILTPQYSQSKIQSKLGGFGTERNKFNVPKGVTVVKDDIFAVADCGNNAIKFFDSLSGEVVQCIYCEENVNTPLPSVVDVCSYKNNSDILVSISREGKILHYTNTGKFISIYSVPASKKSFDIWGITSDLNENIYICDRANGCVLQMNKEMEKIEEFRNSGVNAMCPFYVAIGPDNRIYATDSASNTVVIFSKDGSKHRPLKSQDSLPGLRFKELAGLSFDSAGNLLIVDRGQGKIIVIDPRMDNKYMYVFGVNIKSIGKPEGIAILSDGKVVVSETTLHEIIIF